MAQQDETEVYEIVGEFTEDTQYIHCTHWKVFRRTFKKFIGLELLITVTPLRYKRSDAQNRYMWAVVVKYVRQWLYETQGEKYPPDYVYAWLRVELMGEEPKVIEVAGKEMIVMTGQPFSKMSTKAFAEAIDTIRAKMAKRGLEIPEPTKDKTKHNLPFEFLQDD